MIKSLCAVELHLDGGGGGGNRAPKGELEREKILFLNLQPKIAIYGSIYIVLFVVLYIVYTYSIERFQSRLIFMSLFLCCR